MHQFLMRTAVPPPEIARRGSATIAVIAMLGLVSGMLSFSMAKNNQAIVGSTNSTNIVMDAQNIAQNDADLLCASNYDDLYATARNVVTNTNFEHEIILSDEKDYNNTIKERTATINVYKGQETLPRVTMNVTRYSSEKEFSGVPIGTVIAWPGTKAPTTNGVWLECNGQSCSNYPELVAVLGKNTVPDYRNRFLESDETPGIQKDAGLPNITGSFYADDSMVGKLSPASPTPTGAFYVQPTINYNLNFSVDTKYTGYLVMLDASRFNKIYGNSDTVQPASVTVRRFIKAA